MMRLEKPSASEVSAHYAKQKFTTACYKVRHRNKTISDGGGNGAILISLSYLRYINLKLFSPAAYSLATRG